MCRDFLILVRSNICPDDIQCVYKHRTKSTAFQHSVIKPQLNTLNFWQSDSNNIWKSRYHYVYHLTCVMPMPGKNASDKLHF